MRLPADAGGLLDVHTGLAVEVVEVVEVVVLVVVVVVEVKVEEVVGAYPVGTHWK